MPRQRASSRENSLDKDPVVGGTKRNKGSETAALRTIGGCEVRWGWASKDLVEHAKCTDLCPERNGNSRESFNNPGTESDSHSQTITLPAGKNMGWDGPDREKGDQAGDNSVSSDYRGRKQYSGGDAGCGQIGEMGEAESVGQELF